MARKGIFDFNKLTVVGKRSTTFEGNNYFYITLSDGYSMTEFSVDSDTYNRLEPFKVYSGSCDYVNKKMKLVTLSEVGK